MANEILNTFKCKNLSESHLFLKILWILSRKYVLIPDWLSCWNLVLFSAFSISVHSACRTVFCYELSGCCTFVCTSPSFQRETRLCFTLLINEKFNCYRRCLGKGHTGVKAKCSAFKPACFHSRVLNLSLNEAAVTLCIVVATVPLECPFRVVHPHP